MKKRTLRIDLACCKDRIEELYEKIEEKESDNMYLKKRIDDLISTAKIITDSSKYKDGVIDELASKNYLIELREKELQLIGEQKKSESQLRLINRLMAAIAKYEANADNKSILELL